MLNFLKGDLKTKASLYSRVIIQGELKYFCERNSKVNFFWNRISSAFSVLWHQPFQRWLKSFHIFPVCGGRDVLYSSTLVFHFFHVLGGLTTSWCLPLLELFWKVSGTYVLAKAHFFSRVLKLFLNSNFLTKFSLQSQEALKTLTISGCWIQKFPFSFFSVLAIFSMNSLIGLSTNRDELSSSIRYC